MKEINKVYSVTEIYSLREEGKYQEAFITARRLLELAPEDESLQAAMAWVLYDMLKVALEEDNADSFEELFSVFVDYVPGEADKLQVSGSRLLYQMVMKLLEEQKFAKANDLMMLIKNLKFHPDLEKPKSYYSLLEAAMAFNQQLPNFLGFMRIWRLSNLLPKHYQQYGENMSIAERAYWLVGQHLLIQKSQVPELVAAYVKQLDELLERAPRFHHVRKLVEKLR